MLPIIKYRKIWFILSSLILTISIISLVLFQFKLGIDFTGGTLMEVEINNAGADVVKIKEILTPLDLGDITVQKSQEQDFLIRLKNIDESKHQEILDVLKKGFIQNDSDLVEENRFETIGPTIGKELKSKAVTAVILVVICIILYVAWVFRKVSGKISSWKFGVSAILALFHDVLVVLGVFSLLGHFLGVEVNSMFVIAILTVLGYSVNDTIVVFDRIRYNVLKTTGEFEYLVEKSVNETMVRSINTSATTLLVLLALYLFGGSTIEWFVMALIVGIVAGTYSSIFIASPILVAWEKRRR